MSAKHANRLNSVFYAVCFVVLAGWLYVFSTSFSLVTDLAVVLPEPSGENARLEKAALDRLQTDADSKVFVALFPNGAAQNLTTLDGPTEVLLNFVDNSQYLALSQEEADVGEKYLERVLPYRFFFLSDHDARLIEQSDYSAFESRINDSLYGFPATLSVLGFSDDPLNLFGQFLVESLESAGAGDVVLHDDYIEAKREDGAEVRLFTIQPTSGSFDIATQNDIKSEFDRLRSEVEAAGNVEVIESGTFFHVANATIKARSEVTFISTASIALVVLIFVVAFRTLKPLAFCLGSIVFGFLVAALVTRIVFGDVHMLTFVFGASLIGISVDYAFHFLCLGESRKLAALKGASLLALLSTAFAYAFLMTSSIPVVKQVVVFTVSGLVASWFFVIVQFERMFDSALAVKSEKFQAWGDFGRRLWGRSTRLTFISVLVALIVASGVLLSVSGTVTRNLESLYVIDETLRENDSKVMTTLGAAADINPNQFFAVTGESEDVVLSSMESLKRGLDTLVAQGDIAGYRLLSDYLPSKATREKNLTLVSKMYGEAGAVYDFAPMTTEAVASLKDEVHNASNRSLQNYEIGRIAEQLFPSLWLGDSGSRYTGIVRLQGVTSTSVDPLAALASPPAVRFVNITANWTDALSRELTRASLVLIVSILFIAAALVLWFRKLSAMLIAIVPVASSLLTVAVLALTGESISLFHLFGLYLIIGLGLDYGVFIYRDEENDLRCFIAVALSAMTTIAAFGFLSQSSTPMIAAFGMTIFLGTLFNLVLAPGLGLFRVAARPA